MAHGRSVHPNAPLTVEGRRRIVGCVVDQGWSVAATAERFQIDPKTVRKWPDRWLTEGADGLEDRSCRPHRSPSRTHRRIRLRVLDLRRKRWWGADHIAQIPGIARMSNPPSASSGTTSPKSTTRGPTRIQSVLLRAPTTVALPACHMRTVPTCPSQPDRPIRSFRWGRTTPSTPNRLR